MNEILVLVGTVCICGAFYLMAKKKADEAEKLQSDNEVLRMRLKDKQIGNENLMKWQHAKDEKELEYKKEIKELKKGKDESDRIINELTRIIESDNKIMSKRMEQIGDLQEDVRKGADRFAKNQIEIADLTHDICVANTELGELEENYNFARELAMSRYDEIRYLRRVLKNVRASRLKKVIKAERLVF